MEYERMLDQETVPTVAEMTRFCKENAALFSELNHWLTSRRGTEQKIVFPYGNQYGWGIGHYRKKKLICNVFPESGAFTVMLRLSNRQYAEVYGAVLPYTQEIIDRKYPCGDGGWIHYRVTCPEHYEDIVKLLEIKVPPYDSSL